MKAFVLAAGVGNRLRPYTDTVPKPMLPVGGTPILAYNLAMLQRAGFTDVALNLHYLPDVITSFVGDGRDFGLATRYSYEDALLGTAGALLPLRDWLSDETFAIVFGDNIADLDLSAMLDVHRSTAATVTIALWSRDDVSQSGIAELDRHERVVRFIEKPRPGESESHWVNAGVLIAEPQLLGALSSITPSDIGRDVLPALIAAGLRVQGYTMCGGLWWFDRTEDYERALRDPRLERFTANHARDRAARSGEA
jgi:NDP-sugar pyrophosphorylase family protein